MASIIQQIGTPLQLIALFLILIAGIARLLVRSDSGKPSTTIRRLMINRIFVVALVALVLGTLAGSLPPVLERWANNDEVFHGAVLSTTGDAIPNATVNLLTIASSTTNATGQIDIDVPHSRVRKEYSIQVKAPGYQTPDVMTKTDAQMRNFEIRLTPAPEDLVRSMASDFVVGQYFGAPLILATLHVENPGTSTVNINEIRGTISGKDGSFLVVPVAWTIANPYGPFAPIAGPLPIWAGAKLDLRVAMITGENWTALYSKTSALPEYKSQMPCAYKQNSAPDPMTDAGYAVVKAFAEEHFGWYPGDWKLRIDVTTDNQSKTFNREFSLSPAEIDRLRNSISLLKQCLSVTTTSPLAQDGTVSNFLPK